MITVTIQELTKGFTVEYFDDKQPPKMDVKNVYCQSFDDVQKLLENKFEATLKTRSEEAE